MNKEFALPFLYGFLCCIGFILFPVVVGILVQACRRKPKLPTLAAPKLRTTAVKVGKHAAIQLYPNELGKFWEPLRNTLVGVGYTVDTTFEDGRKVARFYMQEPNS